ncbi:MAG: RpiB/LacA/LacB family sugar-phosphate isomerase, partial [Planctomycetota bacterium]
MRVGIAADHGGFELKELLAKALRDLGYEVMDFGDSGFQCLELLTLFSNRGLTLNNDRCELLGLCLPCLLTFDCSCMLSP